MIDKNFKKLFLSILGSILLTLCVIIIAVIFLEPNPKEDNLIEYLGISLSAIIGVSTFSLVFHEYRRVRKIEEGQFIFSLNSEFINNDDTKTIYKKIYEEKIHPSKNEIDETDITMIVSYLTFLETFWTLRKRKIIDIEMINDLFANRFFLMITNKNVQDLKLLKEYHLYNNIRLLEIAWRDFRLKRGLEDLFFENSFHKQIPKQIASNYFNKKNKALNNDNPITFRSLNASDIDSVLTLQDAVIKGMENKEWLLKTSKQEFKSIIEDDKSIYIGAFTETELIAYTFLTYPKRNFKVFKKRFLFPMFFKDNMYFKVMAVHNDYRNMGISSSFIAVAKKVAEFNKTKRIIATAHPKNEVSNFLMKKNGFNLIKTKKTHKNMSRNIFEIKC